MKAFRPLRIFLLPGLLLYLAACQVQSVSVPAGAVGQVTQTSAPARVVTLVPETTLTRSAPSAEPTDPKSFPTPGQTSIAPPPAPSLDPNLVAEVVAAGVPIAKDSAASPDGRWLADVIRYDCVRTGEDQATAYEVLRLTDRVTKERQDIAGQLQGCGGLGAAGLGQLSWSQNSRFLYYSDAADGQPDGLCGYWQRPFAAYELETGAVYHLGQGANSPDGQKIAFWGPKLQNEPADLIVWDVEEGETGRFAPVEPGWQTGPIAWSPDSSRLAYIRSEEPCPTWGETGVGMVDLAAGQVSLLARSPDPTFTSLTWQDPGALTLRDENGGFWLFDLATDELKKQP